MTDIIHVTDVDFDQAVLQSGQPVLVDFWAPWCGPCKAIAPLLEELAEEFDGQLTIAKVNVDDSPKAAAKLSVRAIPTLALFRDGAAIARQTGAGSLSELRTFVKGNL